MAVAQSAMRPLRRRHPAMLVATLGGVGLVPRAPGTLGSLVALPFAWGVARVWGAGGLVAASLLLFALGWWAASVVTRARGGDPPYIVIDEAAGQFLALAAVPLALPFYAAAFALFRLFDVAKPFPVGWADRHIGGGFGVMFDDVLAALYAAAILLIARYLLGR
jgi:phosphatidylglycerophosphatase A